MTAEMTITARNGLNFTVARTQEPCPIRELAQKNGIDCGEECMMSSSLTLNPEIGPQCPVTNNDDIFPKTKAGFIATEESVVLNGSDGETIIYDSKKPYIQDMLTLIRKSTSSLFRPKDGKPVEMSYEEAMKVVE